jgi:hypothetical protein
VGLSFAYPVDGRNHGGAIGRRVRPEGDNGFVG